MRARFFAMALALPACGAGSVALEREDLSQVVRTDGDSSMPVDSGEPCAGIDNSCDGVGHEENPSCIDKDADGFGSDCALGADCDDGNGNIHPAALELCDDGIDNDCDNSIDEGCGPPAPPPAGSGSSVCSVPANLPSFIDLPATVDTALPPAYPGANIVQVQNGDNLQLAIDNALPGDIIEIAANAVFNQEIHLPNKNTTSTQWITLRSANWQQLPPEDGRLDPSNDAPNMPKITAAASNQYALVVDLKAHHYRIMGIDFGVSGSLDKSSGIIQVGREKQGGQWVALEDLPHHIVFDRVSVRGIKNPQGTGVYGTRLGVRIAGRHLAIINSHISDISRANQESQAIAGIIGDGPYKIVNNYLEASGENVFFGGWP